MKHRLLMVLCCTAALLAPVAQAADAPTFSLPNAQGALVSPTTLRGKVILVDFWASWCLPCLKSFPWLSDIQTKYRDKGLVIVGINMDKTPVDAEKFLKRVPHDFTIAYDPTGDAAKAYNLKTMPSSYLVNRQGALILQHDGFRDTDKESLEASILAALENK